MMRIENRAGLLVLMACGVMLAACGPRDSGAPSFYLDLAQRDVEIDAPAALAMINGYRKNKGLSALRTDPVLQRIAADQARAMAARGKVDGALGRGNLARARLDRAGYAKGPAVENVSAGYRTLAEAFSGWRASPRHDKNMRDSRVTHMGIATAYAPGNKYKVFWSLVLAGPAAEAGGAAAGDGAGVPAAKP